MPVGFRVDSDVWLKEYEDAKLLAQEVVQLIQERSITNGSEGPEASRKTVAARRKVGTLGTQLEKLLKMLDTPDYSTLSEQEKNRRRDLLYELRNRREQLLLGLRRHQVPGERDMLLSGSSSASFAPRETEATAALDARGLLTLQDQVMQQQDRELEAMEKSVINTKHIALAIGEEVELHTRLLDDVEEGVDVTTNKLRATSRRIRDVIRRSSNFKMGLCIFILIVTFVVVALVVFKVIKLVA